MRWHTFQSDVNTPMRTDLWTPQLLWFLKNLFWTRVGIVNRNRLLPSCVYIYLTGGSLSRFRKETVRVISHSASLSSLYTLWRVFCLCCQAVHLKYHWKIKCACVLESHKGFWNLCLLLVAAHRACWDWGTRVFGLIYPMKSNPEWDFIFSAGVKRHWW